MSQQIALESLKERWLRRCITIPAYIIAWSTVTAGLIPLMVIAMLIDALRRTAFLRCLAYVWFYLTLELIGLGVALLLWCLHQLKLISQAHYEHKHHQLQWWWAGGLFKGAIHCFGLKVQCEGLEQAQPGPLYILMSHASLTDTFLPATYLSQQQGYKLRYVMKRELLWDPCLDVVGQRLNNVFVRRGSDAAKQEIAGVAQLAQQLNPDEGVLIYPEGTRYSQAKRKQILASLKAKEKTDDYDQALKLSHVLPAKNGGALALLETNAKVDALIVAHSGMAGSNDLLGLLKGKLRHKQIRIKMWRINHRDIPTSASARKQWLQGTWAQVNDFIKSEDRQHN